MRIKRKKPEPTLAERVQAEVNRTDIECRIDFDRKTMEWVGKFIDGGKNTSSPSERLVFLWMLGIYRNAPTKDRTPPEPELVKTADIVAQAITSTEIAARQRPGNALTVYEQDDLVVANNRMAMAVISHPVAFADQCRNSDHFNESACHLRKGHPIERLHTDGRKEWPS